MIGPDDVPAGWQVGYVLRLTAPDGSVIDVAKDDGTPATDWEEVVAILTRAHGTAVRREAIRRRRRDRGDRRAG